jgi:hypothetical protein
LPFPARNALDIEMLPLCHWPSDADLPYRFTDPNAFASSIDPQLLDNYDHSYNNSYDNTINDSYDNTFDNSFDTSFEKDMRELSYVQLENLLKGYVVPEGHNKAIVELLIRKFESNVLDDSYKVLH